MFRHIIYDKNNFDLKIIYDLKNDFSKDVQKKLKNKIILAMIFLHFFKVFIPIQIIDNKRLNIENILINYMYN